jgi:ArsR family transcriptional regulator
MRSHGGHAESQTVPGLGDGPLSRQEAQHIASILKIVSDPTRLQLLGLIQASSTGEACVCDLTQPLGLRQPTISHHLKVLVNAGILQRQKRGNWAWYSIAPDRSTSVADLLR